MAGKSKKVLRCAIYTRKSTEHGLELEFNSLDAQREACEAYIKSQASEGWRVLLARYDDAAYSGGNLDRPALQRLLKDLDAEMVDVIVVYKIDRLTRSLTDFAKLVEIFEAKNVSFVAITQQFNTVHQVLKRINGDPEHMADFVEASRAVLHGALAIYLIRYLSVPPARLSAEGDEPLESMPSTIEEIRSALMDAFDRQHQIDAAAHLVMRHLTLGHPPESIMSALARALLPEDAGFHAYQMLEARARQFGEWGNTEPGRHILVAVARYLAAHSPTERSWLRTADIAARLSRGDQLHADEPPARC